MKKISEKIVFFGNERLATGVSTSAPTLQKLLGAGYEIAAVVSNYDTAVSRAARQLEIAKVAETHSIPVFTPDDPLDIVEKLREYGSPLAVLVAYGRIVPEIILELFPRGIINIHPSLLPEKRGPTPIEQAILEGANETGVSIMHLVPEMDAGPIFAQQKIPLNGTETKQDLANKLLDIGGDLLINALPEILTNTINPLLQEESRATYTSLLKKADGEINWHKPAAQVEREIRAFAGWPRSRTTLQGNELIINQAKVIDMEGQTGNYQATKNSLVVFCADKALQIISLQPAGKKEMPVQAFLAGYKL